MAFGTVDKRLRQIEAAIKNRIAGDRLRLADLVKEQKLPDANGTAQPEGRPQIMRRRFAGNRRQGPQIGVKVFYVLDLHSRIARIGKGRIIMAAVRRYAGDQRICEIFDGPGADPVGNVGGYIRRTENAEGGGKRHSASEHERVRLSRRGMAGPAA